ncbi:transposase domain-containing protein [Pseudomonas sp. nanlin1]
MALSCIAALGKKEATDRAQSAAAVLLAPESGVEAAAARAPLLTHCFAVFAPFRKIAQLASVLIQSARLNGHDPYAYLKDVLTRLPTQRASEITELLPHRWVPV